MTLSNSELSLYNRQINIEGMGLQSQTLLKQARVLVVGAGGLGCPTLLYLASAGVGTLGIVDDDKVAEHNLHRQILFNHTDIGKNKATIAKINLSQLNPHITVTTHQSRFTKENSSELIAQYDIVVDGTDNFKTRFLINDTCLLSNKPLVYGAIQQFEGQLSVFNLNNPQGISFNLRDIFPDEPKEGIVANCSIAGALGATTGVIGSLMATEVIKIITGFGTPNIGNILAINLKNMNFSTFSITKQQPLKNQNPEITSTASQKKVNPSLSKNLSPAELKSWIKSNVDFILIDIREEYERRNYHIGGTHMPLSEFDPGNIAIPKNKKVVLYCEHGIRSAQLKSYLEKNFSFANLFQLKGGVAEWKNEPELKTNK